MHVTHKSPIHNFQFTQGDSIKYKVRSLPPSLTHWTAPSIKGAAVPYGSKSTTSTRSRSERWLYISALKIVRVWTEIFGVTYQASPSFTLTLAGFTFSSSFEALGSDSTCSPSPFKSTFRLIASAAVGDKSLAMTYLTKPN